MALRMTVVAVTVLLLIGSLAPAAQATNLPAGAWTAIANGVFGTFQVNGVDGSGNLNATFFGDPTTGFWNSTSNRITFLRQDAQTLQTVQYFDGHLMVLPGDAPGLSFYILAGFFTAFSGTGGTPPRPDFAWVAIMTAPSP